MASAGNSEPSRGDAIQFDRAEFTTAAPGTVECSACKRPIAESYYELNGQVLCEPCVRAIDSAFVGGSRSRRFLKAGLFGFAAAVGGAIIIYLFRTLTGWEAALISILAGYMVGSAVRQGTGYRGGRVYQFMALFLTYSALSWSYLPDITKAVLAQAQKRQDGAVKGKAADVKNVAPAANLAWRAGDQLPPPPKGATTAAKEGDDAAKTEKAAPVVVKPAPIPNAAEKPDQPMSPVGFVLILGAVVVFVIGFMYSLPVINIVSELPQGLIGLLIIFWGMQQAWQLTRKVTLDFRGPFRVGERRPSQPGVPAHG